MPITFETTERVAILTINRPLQMNALDWETLASLNKAWIEFRDNPELWVAIITGAGVKAFCAGADIKVLDQYYRSTTAIQRKEKADSEPGLGGITRNLEIWKPIIASI
ncbi:MAG: enoyl-CoA hydratase/isomerase family protein, partial [Deltaproteobacteria bacterium]|nr:enoyl-CoA hydratase/isomerase family protein [Deltaproteobacteria bacterium]